MLASLCHHSWSKPASRELTRLLLVVPNGSELAQRFCFEMHDFWYRYLIRALTVTHPNDFGASRNNIYQNALVMAIRISSSVNAILTLIRVKTIQIAARGTK